MGRFPIITKLPDYQITKLPTAFRDAGNVAFERQLAEAQAAQRELSHVRAGASAQVAAVAQADLVLRRLLFLRDLGRRCHLQSSVFSLQSSVRLVLPKR